MVIALILRFDTAVDVVSVAVSVAFVTRLITLNRAKSCDSRIFTDLGPQIEWSESNRVDARKGQDEKR